MDAQQDIHVVTVVQGRLAGTHCVAGHEEDDWLVILDAKSGLRFESRYILRSDWPHGRSLVRAAVSRRHMTLPCGCLWSPGITQAAEPRGREG